MNFLKLLFLVIPFSLIRFSCIAAENHNESFISKAQWSKYSKNYDYTETYKTFKKKESKNNKNEIRPLSTASNDSIKTIVLIIVIVVLGILIILLILNILKGVGEQVKPNNRVIIINNIENLEDVDLEEIMQTHITGKQYKEALRIKYLILLRTLNRLMLIKWKKDKTNGIYINEMAGKNGFEQFFQITLTFDRIWYGDKEIYENEYYQIIPLFDKFNIIDIPGEK